MRYLKALFFSVLLIGLMTGSAFAQAALNAGNTALAAEKISPTVDYPLGNINTGYQTGGPIAATTVIKISLTNGKFTVGNTIGIFDTFLGVVGTGIVPAAPNNTSVNITLTFPLASGTVYQIWNLTTGPPLTGVFVPAGSPAGTIVTLSLDSVTIPGDPTVVASAPAITVKNQFSATLAPITSKLDFADNQETFLPSLPMPARPPRTFSNLESQAGLRIISDDSIQDKILLVGGPGPCNWLLGAGDAVNARETGNLTGIGFVEYQGAATTTYAITAVDRTNGNATLSVLGNLLDICKSTDTSPFNSALELTAANTAGTSIQVGIRTAQISLTGGGLVVAGYNRDLIAAGATSHDIQLDATQFYIPLVGSSGLGRETYIKIQSKSTISGGNGVNVQILASNGSIVPYSAGTITSGTPLTITGAQLVDAATAGGNPVDGMAGFAVIITVNAPEADVFAYANMIDAAGAKRIPVKTVGGNIVE